jgi:hypothetical protein
MRDERRRISLFTLIACLTLLAGLLTLRLESGRVSTPTGPAEGARVRLQGHGNSVVTDSCGRFHLPTSPDPTRITAWKEGYFIASARAGERPLEIRLRPLPLADNPDYAWVSPEPDPAAEHNCANCHREIYREWKQSGHSRSVSGGHFRNLYEGTDASNRPGVGWGLLTQYEAGAAVCLACHAPTVEDPVASLETLDATGMAEAGVHCDYCHKVADAGQDQIGLRLGRYNLKLLRPGPDQQVFFGPLDDADRGDDAHSPLYRESRYCASCHEGVVFGVHAYSTWSEWLESPARAQGKQCQDCHVKPTGQMTNMAPGRGGVERDPATLGNHRFFAGSQEEMLRKCLHLEASWNGSRTLTLKLEARDVGHRVPTGFPDRQLLLVVEAFDAQGQLLQIMTGPHLSTLAGPKLAGKSGRLYAKVLRDLEDHSPAPFWRARPEFDDNRLRPNQPEVLNWTVPAEAKRIQIRILLRRFWDEVRRSKGWPEEDLSIARLDFVPPWK